MPKLPSDLTRTGASVAVRLPIGDGMVAHKTATSKRKATQRVYGQSAYEDVTVPACDQDGPKAVQLTAAWADAHGAIACTEPACFPTA